MNHSLILPAGLLVLLFSTTAFAQDRAFYNRGFVGGAYEPVIDVVTSGAQILAQPVVSHDRKYVTLSMQPQLSQLVDLQSFPVVRVANGFVGGAVPAPANPNQPADINASRPIPIPTARGGPILNRPGMTRIE